jgi:hypothetical protein
MDECFRDVRRAVVLLSLMVVQGSSDRSTSDEAGVARLVLITVGAPEPIASSRVSRISRGRSKS